MVDITILIPLRFPTEKAYGINSGYTAEALRKLGHDVIVIANTLDQTDDTGNRIHGLPVNESKFIRWFLNSKFTLVTKYGFFLSQLIFAFKVGRIPIIAKRRYLVVSRFPIILCLQIYLRRFKHGILELHHLPNQFEIALMNMSPNGYQVTVTNDDFKKQLSEMGFKGNVFLLPNVAPDSIHSLGNEVHQFSLPLVIGYAGKTSSSGNDNELKIIIELLTLYPEISDLIKFQVIGCEESFSQVVASALERKIIPDNSIKVLGHLPHNELIKELRNFDLAIIPYPETKYYQRSFPIKIIEMASAGIPMIATNTIAHRRILGPLSQFLYEPGSTQSLRERIMFLTKNLKYLEEERKRLLVLSRNSTYEFKAKTLLHFIEDV